MIRVSARRISGVSVALRHARETMPLARPGKAESARAAGDLARAVGPVAGVAEAGDDIAVVVQHLVHRGRPDRDVGMRRAQDLAPGREASRQTKRMSVTPASFSRSIAAIAVWPVASIGSTMITSRSCDNPPAS